MSLEQSIADLAAAINNFTVVYSRGQAAVTPTVTATAELKAEYPKQEKAKVAKPTPAATPTTATASAAPSESATNSEPKVFDFVTQIQQPIVAMAKGGRRDEAVAILTELGVAKASELKESQYAAAVALLAKAG